MGDSFVERAGSFLDPVTAALQTTIGLYSQVQAIKLNNQLARARASAEDISKPTPMQDVQAIAASVDNLRINNPWVIGAAVLVGAAALYVIVK